MIFLQSQTTELVNRAFDISPTSIYGFALAGCVLIILALTTGAVYMTRKYITLIERFPPILDKISDRLEALEDKF